MKQPMLHPVMKKIITGYLVIFTLLVGTVVGLQLVEQSQDIRQQATDYGVDLAVVSSNTAPRVGDTFTVQVRAVRLNGKQVSAADIRLQFNQSVLRLDSMVPGQFFNRRGSMQVQYPTAGGDAIVFPNITPTPGVGRIALGAMCDYCFLGPTPLPTYQPQSPMPTLARCPNTNPACYPITVIPTGTSGPVLATYTFTAIAAGTSALTITGTEVASIDSDVNVVGDLTGTSLTVAQNITPTPTGVACGGADISANGTTSGTDGRVNAADINYLLTKWSGFNACTNNNCGGADISSNGTSFGQDGRVNAADINYLLTKWSGFNACQ